MIRSSKHRWTSNRATCRGSAIGLAILLPLTTLADAVVTDCTQAALETALSQGGLVRFANNCTLTLSKTLLITNEVTLSSGGREVVLTSGTNFSLVTVRKGSVFSADDIHFRGGRSELGGAMVVQTGAIVSLENCTFTDNEAIGGDGLDGNDGGDDSSGIGSNGGSGKDGIAGAGGAIYNQGTLSCSNVVFSENRAAGGTGGDGGDGGDGSYGGGEGGRGGKGAMAAGGAILNLGVLRIHSSSFMSNSVAGGSGGIRGEGGAGPFAGWPGRGGAGAPGFGGAICSSNYLELNASTFAWNATQGGNSQEGGTDGGGTGTDGPNGGLANGGAIWNATDAVLTNCTFFVNAVRGGSGGDGGPGTYGSGDGGYGGNGNGGSIGNAGTMIIVNCTLAAGAAFGGTNGVAGSSLFPGSSGQPGQSRGGNLANLAGTLWLNNTIAGYATNGGSGYGTVSDGGHNISADRSMVLNASRVNTDPKLGSPDDNGGLTLTIMPLPGSPAVNTANDNSAPEVDQRGEPRPGLGTPHSDIGAVEGIGPTISMNPEGQTRTNGQTVSFTVTAEGDPPLLYRWRLYGTNLPSATNVTLVITNISAKHYGPYTVLVSNAFGKVVSEEAWLEQGAATLTSPRLLTPSLTTSNVLFSWLSQATQPYRLQYKDSLRNTNWVQVTNVIVGTGNWMTNIQSVTNGISSRFYRLISP